MATNTSKTTSTKSKAKPEPVDEVPKTIETETSSPSKPSMSDIDIHQYVTVRNGFNGVLVYRSPKTGEKFLWDNFEDEQEMELQELKNAKSSAKKYFINNWFLLDDWVIEFLGLTQYYKNTLSIDELNSLLDKSPAQVSKTISTMTEGQKKSLTYKVMEMYKNEQIDSNKMIATLEDALGVVLTER